MPRPQPGGQFHPVEQQQQPQGQFRPSRQMGQQPPRPSPAPQPGGATLESLKRELDQMKSTLQQLTQSIGQMRQQQQSGGGQTGPPGRQPAPQWAHGSAGAPGQGGNWPPQGASQTSPAGAGVQPQAELPPGVGGYGQPGMPPSTPAQSMPRGWAPATQDAPGQDPARPTFPGQAYQAGQPGWIPR